MTDTIKYRFRCRRRTATNWTTINEILLAQEIGLESDTGLGKIGDGSTAWNDLLYTIVGQVDLDGLADGKCLAWDSTNNKWYVADRGVAYTAGTGISIDASNPDAPIINNTLGSIAVDDRVLTYSNLPNPPPAGLTTYLVDADNLIYIWDGSSWPVEGEGIAISGLSTQSVYLSTPGAVRLPNKAYTMLAVQIGNQRLLVPAFSAVLLDDFTKLFSQSEVGALYDISDLSTLWTDLNKTVPAAVNDFVAVVTDKSGNGNDLVQDNVAKRPKLIQDVNGKYGLSFNGSNQSLHTSVAMLLNTTDQITVMYGVDKTISSSQMLAECGSSYSDPGEWYAVLGTDSPGKYDTFRSSGVVSNPPAYRTTNPLGIYVGTAFIDRKNTTVSSWYNGSAGNPGVTDSGVFGNKTLHVGARTDSQLYFSGTLYGLVICGRALTPTEQSEAEAFMATKCGITF